MATFCGATWNIVACGGVGPPVRRRKYVVMCASVEEGSRATTVTTATPNNSSPQSDVGSTSSNWLGQKSSAAAAPSGSVVNALKANRGLRLIRSESRRLGDRRLAASASLIALIVLALCGQDLIARLGAATRLPVEDLDGLIYFIICFGAVSSAMPKSRYDKWR